MKKKILIGILIAISFFASIIMYFVITDLKEESKLKKEMTEVSSMIRSNNMDMKAFNARLNTTKTKGDYAVVEKAFKNYLKDFFANIVDIIDILDDKKITNSLTVENYIADGPDFTNTKSYIEETSNKLEKDKSSYYNFFEEDKIMSYLKKDGLDSYYKDLYRDEIIGDINDIKNDKSLEESIEKVVKMLDSSKKVIDFLANNKSSWKVEGEQILFSSQSLLDEYNSLVAELTKY